MTRNYLTSNPAILNEARDYLDGLILGDGNIHHPRGRGKTSYYQHKCKYKNWLDKIDDDLYEYGIECGVSNERLHTGGFCSESGSILFYLWTHSYTEFKKMHDRFYIKWYDIDDYPETRWHEDKDSKGDWYIWQKIVPKDICLTPVCIANWYLGDGGTYKHTYENGYYTRLSTDGFLKEDTIFLVDLLSKLFDIKCSITKQGVIQISTQADISTFLNYIKNYKVDCYNYKFPDIF